MEVNYKLNKVRELASGDEDFVEAIATAFLEEVPEAIIQINEGLKNKDCSQVYQNAHKIKPTIQMFDIAVLEDLLIIQDWGKFEKITDDVSLHLERVNAVIKAVTSEIKSDFSL
jgi:HPt (histidine-containing phosphotransfer) domain-containing protein